MAEMNLNTAKGFKMGTRINSIIVPEELRHKKSSGIEWFDAALGSTGGFTPSSVMMLTGSPGAGKSTLIRQLADSITSAGHIVMLNSGEESLFQCRMACERLKVTQDFMVGEEKMLPRLLTFMDNVKKENPGKQLFLLQDSIATLDDAKYVDAKGESRGTTGKTPVYCTEALVDWAQQSYGIVIFICQVTKSGEFSGSNKIKHAIDIHGHLFVDEAPKSDTYGCLLFEVTKNRWGCNAVTTILQMTDTGLEERGTFRKAGATQ